jgi:hypothetical protein
MAGLLTPEEWAAAAGARFGPGQLGPTALGLSECCGIFACMSFNPLLLYVSDWSSDPSKFSLCRLLVLPWGS